MPELSLHFERLETEVTNVVRGSNLEWVLVLDPPLENPFPGKKIVGRFFDDREQEFVGQGAWGAEKWWFRNGARVAQRAHYLHAIIVVNEPNYPVWCVADEYMRHWIYLCNINHPELKTVGPNFSVGVPEPHEAHYFIGTIKMVDYVGFHEYWLPEHWENQEAWESWLMGRYKRFMDNLPSALQDKPILITEAGCDGLTSETLNRKNVEDGWQVFYKGNRDAYLADLTKYRNLLDSRVEAVFVYGAGPWPRWKTYAIDVQLAEGILQINETRPPKEEEPMKTVRVKMESGAIVVMDIEDYVKGVVPREVYASWPEQVLEAQAIAARTYALSTTKHHAQGYDVCTTTCCQVYGPNRHARTNKAVDYTQGIVGVHKVTGKMVPMFYSASCGGHTKGNWGDYLKEWIECPCKTRGRFPVQGHQNGMCQWGAYYLAVDGNSFWESILDKYYDLYWVEEYGEGDVLNPDPVLPIDPEPSCDLERRVDELELELDELKLWLSTHFKPKEITIVTYGK